MPEFYIIIAQKIFFLNFFLGGGGTFPLTSVSYAYIEIHSVSKPISNVYYCVKISGNFWKFPPNTKFPENLQPCSRVYSCDNYFARPRLAVV